MSKTVKWHEYTHLLQFEVNKDKSQTLSGKLQSEKYSWNRYGFIRFFCLNKLENKTKFEVILSF